jgi:hypothetical protein
MAKVKNICLFCNFIQVPSAATGIKQLNVGSLVSSSANCTTPSNWPTNGYDILSKIPFGNLISAGKACQEKTLAYYENSYLSGLISFITWATGPVFCCIGTKRRLSVQGNLRHWD